MRQKKSQTGRQRSSLKDNQSLHSRKVFQLVWGPTRGEWVEVEESRSFSIADLDDVVPGQDMLMVDPIWPNKFYIWNFHHSMSWDSIVELVGAKKIYKYDDQTDELGRSLKQLTIYGED